MTTKQVCDQRGSKQRWAFLLSSDQQETLKWLAFSSMVIDHAGKVFGDSWVVTTVLGRVAFPIFTFLVAYNLTVRNVKPQKYLGMLLVFGAVLQPIYAWTFGLQGKLNVLFTLLLGVVVVWLFDWLVPYVGLPISSILITLLVWPLATFVDYGLAGVLLVASWRLVLFHQFSLVLPMLMLFFANGGGVYGVVAGVASLLPFLWLPSVQRLPRRLFYVFYPLHLAVLKALAWLGV
jgi:hypothetical protein